MKKKWRLIILFIFSFVMGMLISLIFLTGSFQWLNRLSAYNYYSQSTVITRIILLSPVFLVYTFITSQLVGMLRTTRHWPVGSTRKLFHLLIFNMAGFIQLIYGLTLVILFGIYVSCFILYALMRGESYPFYEAIARPQDHPRRSVLVLTPLIMTALGGYLSNLFFGTFAALGIFVCGWGDAMGELIGCRWGRHKFTVPSLFGVPAIRSLEGSFAVALASIVVSFFLLLFWALPWHTALWIAIVTGLIGAVAEAFSSHGLDNLTIQLSTSGTAFLLTGYFS
ncbi:hypothetical protein OQJ05_15115 [Fluoribacter gormanii]|uniref:diacylglycerol/polyprenol kinase family protein n=1 Tax=Fluoribacter gormanii TaxID=464 RepID=UPI002243D273|nr:hypothetical protein [Fluoribacter gormanii]MCW8445375.1 hypothetical protein [Fluoribacter gormanii]